MQETVISRHVVFSHGKESGPWGRKISALAEVARSEGYELLKPPSAISAESVAGD